MKASKRELQFCFNQEVLNLVNKSLAVVDFQNEFEWKIHQPKILGDYFLPNPMKFFISVSYCAKREDMGKIARSLDQSKAKTIDCLQTKLRILGFELQFPQTNIADLRSQAEDEHYSVERESECEFSSVAISASITTKAYKAALKDIAQKLISNKKLKPVAENVSDVTYNTTDRSFRYVYDNWNRFNKITLELGGISKLRISDSLNFLITLNNKGEFKVTDKTGIELHEERDIILKHIESLIPLEAMTKAIFSNNRIFALAYLTYNTGIQNWFRNLRNVEFSNSRA